jgi:hypothetical protein
MKNEENPEKLDLYNYRIKKIFNYDKYGGTSIKYHAQRKVKFMGWVYFDSVNSMLPNLEHPFMGLIYIIVSIISLTAILIGSLEVLIVGESGWPIFIWSTVIFMLFNLIFATLWYKITYFTNYTNNNQAHIESLIKSRAIFVTSMKKKNYEIIELSLSVERKRKLEKLG